jgi:hypothetical protein
MITTAFSNGASYFEDLKIKPSDIEFKLSQPNYTVNTLVHLQENIPITSSP